MIVSPAEALLMAVWIVRQALSPAAVPQVVESFPRVPSTYQVLAAWAADTPIANKMANTARWPRLFGLRVTDVVVVLVPVAVFILAAFQFQWLAGSRLVRNFRFELARCFVDTSPHTALTQGAKKEESLKMPSVPLG